jgi:dGTPase
MTMEWRALFSQRRLSHDGVFQDAPHQAQRSPFERDWDRVLFSTAFRRMHDKTQVFPLPDNDVVHSRLTHSLEVASIGRSLGKTVARTLLARNAELARHVDAHDFGDVVAAGCLAHDIGNPPFGHAGENAIATYFESGEGRAALEGLTPRQRTDFEKFEGNAQGFRILTRLQLEADGGLQLTAATLAAFTKYPRASGDDLRIEGMAATKKHGFFQHEAPGFAALAKETGLVRLDDRGDAERGGEGGASWARHPLAYLVEAADDVCYSILDIEDGVRLGYVEAGRAEELLGVLARRTAQFSEARLAQCADPMTRIGYLRAMAIGQMIDECAGVFVDEERALMGGTMRRSLADSIGSARDLKALQELALERCYQAPDVLEIELAGYRALGGLLALFVPAAVSDDGRAAEGPRNVQHQKALALLHGRGVRTPQHSTYERILRVTDHVSGMTDRHALATFRRITGIAIPGRAG